MTDATDSQAEKRRLDITDTERLRYLGFDVGPSTIGELFKTKDEERKFIDHVVDKRDHNDVFRDTSNFREERISAPERYIVFGACVMVVLSLFLPFAPWISGYIQTETEVSITDAAPQTDAAVEGQPGADISGAEETGATGATETSEGSQDTDDDGLGADDETPTAAQLNRQSAVGFQDLEVGRKKTKIVKTPYSWSGLSILLSLGSSASMIFSSGIVLILSGILFFVYMLLSLAIPGYIGYSVLTIKGQPDEVALKLKGILKLAWIPVLVWVGMLLLSVVGADYGFDTTDSLKQVGEAYGISAFLGLLGTGFYLSLAGFVLAGSKSVEI